MISRLQRSNSPTSSAIASGGDTPVTTRLESQSYASPGLTASQDVPPKWSVWPFFRAIPWGIGPLLEIIANSARYTVTFEDVAEFIVDSILYECNFRQGISKDDHHRTQVEDPAAGRGGGGAENTREKGVWVNKKIGLIASSGNTRR